MACGKKWYKCPYCDYLAASTQSLGGHVKTHRYEFVAELLKRMGLDPGVVDEARRADLAPSEVLFLVAVREIVSRLERIESMLDSGCRENREKDTKNTRTGSVKEVAAEEPAGSEELSGLPEFVKDNPWVEVLSRR